MSDDVDRALAGLDDWRGDLLRRIRMVITSADPDIVEEMKWRKPANPLGVPTWSRNGLICTGETYKDKVKLTFAHGAALPDPTGLFRDDPGRTRRAVDLRRDDTLDADALRALVLRAIEHNKARSAPGKRIDGLRDGGSGCRATSTCREPSG